MALGYGPLALMAPLGILVFWILVAAFVVYLVRRSAGHGPQDEAIEILRRRYARGEISREEYTAMHEDLTRPGPRP